MPDARPPIYGAHGQLLNEWLIVASFQPAREALTLSWTKDGDRWRRTQQGAVAFPQHDVDHLVDGFRVQVRMLHEPRLL